MIDFYFWPTPNGYKVLQFLLETKIPYRLIPINISKGEQFKPGFLKISPNNKMPAIVDHDPIKVNESIAIFESGAILLYLAEKTGRFITDEIKQRAEVLQWLFWQMAGLGPMAGQNFHFSHYAPERLPYAINRYVEETARLFKVMESQLAEHDYLAGEYSIADMASYPWVVMHKQLKQDLNDFPNLQRWYEEIKKRPATIDAYQIGMDLSNAAMLTEKTKETLAA